MRIKLRYRNVPLVSPGLIQVRKGFWVGLQLGELLSGGADKRQKKIVWKQDDKNYFKSPDEEFIEVNPL